MAITRERFDKIAGDGKIASCEFIKKDGSLRKMVFRTQVTKGVTKSTWGNTPCISVEFVILIHAEAGVVLDTP